MAKVQVVGCLSDVYVALYRPYSDTGIAQYSDWLASPADASYVVHCGFAIQNLWMLYIIHTPDDDGDDSFAADAPKLYILFSVGIYLLMI